MSPDNPYRRGWDAQGLYPSDRVAYEQGLASQPGLSLQALDRAVRMLQVQSEENRAEKTRELQAGAYDEGYERGLTEGITQGKDQLRQWLRANVWHSLRFANERLVEDPPKSTPKGTRELIGQAQRLVADAMQKLESRMS
jgi:flagellar biosynthesis/type III secretory pathway protein FliH